jgi:hypothetical protein
MFFFSCNHEHDTLTYKANVLSYRQPCLIASLRSVLKEGTLLFTSRNISGPLIVSYYCSFRLTFLTPRRRYGRETRSTTMGQLPMTWGAFQFSRTSVTTLS